MPSQLVQAFSGIESTYKAREVEGIVDLYFYRPIGFRLAQLFAKIGATPGMVTLCGGVLGVLAGHLYFYRDLRINIVGMALHVSANALDNADGQLARLTGRRSREGRVIDSVADHLIFLSIYMHLTLRYLVQGGPLGICLVVLGAGISHALQGAAADYFRNGYLYFVLGRWRADFDLYSALVEDYRQRSWRSGFWSKLLLALHLNFTRQQQMLAPNLTKLRDMAEGLFVLQIPDWLRRRYRDAARPMFKWWSLLMTNTRMFVLFLFLLLGQPIWYFWIELSLLNLLFVCLIYDQEKMARSLIKAIEKQQGCT
jgi:phosphatidylglycerophosphate synthase